MLEKACAEPWTSNLSRIAARAITTPTQPPKACKIRAAIRLHSFVASTHRTSLQLHKAQAQNKEAFSTNTVA